MSALVWSYRENSGMAHAFEPGRARAVCGVFSLDESPWREMKPIDSRCSRCVRIAASKEKP